MSYNCPNCGTALDLKFRHVKMLTCDTCGTSLYLDNEQFRLAGERGVMHDAPLLFGLGDEVTVNGATYRPIGHARFSYGAGWWDEFWVDSESGEGVWISLDEGDVAFQIPLTGADRPKYRSRRLFATCTFRGGKYTITEVDQATCIALVGSFPELLEVGETYTFINATNEFGELLSGEFSPEGEEWFTGFWIDPFDVQVRR